MGRALMGDVENWAQEGLLLKVRLDLSFALNLQAQRMYQRLGYAIRGGSPLARGLFAT